VIKILVIGVGGFLGAIARYGLTSWVQKGISSPFPFGTLAANVLGCFLMGILIYLIQEKAVFPPESREFLLIGLLGALTTFSTFSLETIRLVQTGLWMFAAGNVIGSVVLCLGALALGRILMKIFLP
jgi:CrcB protein